MWQEDLFSGIRDLIVSMLDGYNVCMFAYGQTGSGKTFSMQGSKENPGVYSRTFNELFKAWKWKTCCILMMQMENSFKNC